MPLTTFFPSQICIYYMRSCPGTMVSHTHALKFFLLIHTVFGVNEQQDLSFFP